MDTSSRRRSILHPLSFLLSLALLASPLAAAGADPPIVQAAQRGDLEAVKSLLEGGADVDSPSRYGATPLFFATDKGNVEMVKLLLAHGASPEAKDTFYGATPIQWTLFEIEEDPVAREILLLLVRHLAEEGDDLGFLATTAAEKGDLEIARALIESGRVSDESLFGAAEIATGEGHAELAGVLREAMKGEVAPRPSLTAEQRGRLLGSYRHADSGSTVAVTENGGEILLQFAENPPQRLLVVDPSSFDVIGMPEAKVRFEPAEGPADQVVWVYGEREFPFARHDPLQAAAAAEPKEPGEAKPAAPAPVVVERGEARPWPEFRGPNRSGVADGQGVPTTWGGDSGDRVAWKTEIPGLGVSSPVIWGRHVFVTTAVSDAGDRSLRTGLYGDVDSVEDTSVHSWRVFALDRDTGQILWEREAHRGEPEVKRHLKSSHASPTPVTNGEVVVVSFGSAGLYAYDFAGKLLWKKDLGVLSSGWFYDPTYEWEFGSSPVIVGDAVVLQADVNGDSFLAAWDLATGEERWRTPRDEISTWGTPTVLPNPKGPAELVTNAPTVRGYDASTGELLWSLAPNSEITVASPIVAGGIAYVTGGYAPVQPIYAIRPGARGELAAGEEKPSDALAWSTERGGAYIPTPIVYDGLLYLFHNNGRLAIFDATSGEEVAKGRIGVNESFSASPIAADDRLFFTAESGTTYVVGAGPETPTLAENTIGEPVMATPAASDGWLVIRGAEHVFGIAAPPREGSEEAAAQPSAASSVSLLQ